MTEVVRWEEDEWGPLAEAGPKVPKNEGCMVSLGVSLTADQFAQLIVDRGVGERLGWDEAGAE